MIVPCAFCGRKERLLVSVFKYSDSRNNSTGLECFRVRSFALSEYASGDLLAVVLWLSYFLLLLLLFLFFFQKTTAHCIPNYITDKQDLKNMYVHIYCIIYIYLGTCILFSILVVSIPIFPDQRFLINIFDISRFQQANQTY